MSENQLACQPSGGWGGVALDSSPAASRTNGAVLEAHNLHKSYGTRKVVDDISLNVARGEGLALLGPNGSGKTTLLSLIAGVARADSGVVIACGKSTQVKRARRAIGFVPQHPAVYDGLSGSENVALFGKLNGLSGGALHDGVRGALLAAELWTLRDQRASTYSGGMRRRLSLACALVHAPALLLLDEPFEGVDDTCRAHLLEVLTASKRQGVALVLSTHRVEEVTALCERYVMLVDGRVVAERAVAGSGTTAAQASGPVADSTGLSSVARDGA
jgi:ABC-2 type transport system ATP-binding protein